MNPLEHIQIDPAICHGKPVIRETRVPVSVIVGSLSGGMSMEEIEHEYRVTRLEIKAALAFANELVQQESFHNLPHVA